jgi:hypothetical protein
MRSLKWAVLAVVLLVIGAVIGAALDGERAASPGAAAKGSVNANAAATATPTSKPQTAAPSRKSKPREKAPKAPAPTPTPTAKPPTFVACDANIRARAATTTCEFAQNVFYEYWYSWTYYESAAFAAYSRAASEWFDMRCVGTATITCRASDRGEVRFPMSAVVAYTERNATTYSSKHKVSASPDGYFNGGAPPDADPEYSAPEPSYGGDLDCSDFADTDFPTPPGDPDELDADNDGIACES